FFFSSRRRHTRFSRDWSSDVCSSDLMCAVLVFDKLFFSAADPFMATLLALGTFAAGFLARPLGGVVFGILGDRIGRKKVLVVSRSEERRVGKECRKLCAPNQRHSA